MRIIKIIALVFSSLIFGGDEFYNDADRFKFRTQESYVFERYYGNAVDKIKEAQFDSALFQIREAQCWAERSKDTLQIVKSMRILAIVKRTISRAESFSIYDRAILIAESLGYFDELVKLKIGYAIARTFHAEYGTALRIYLQAVTIAKKNHIGGSDVGVIYNNMGFIYYKLSNLEKALFYFKKSLDVKIELQDVFDIERLYINMALCYINMADYSNAIKHIEQALSFCGNYCHEQTILESQFALGMVNFELRKYNEAKFHFENSLGISRERQEYRFMAESLHFLTRVCLKKNQHRRAHEYLSIGQQLAISQNLKEVLLENYSLFVKLFYAVGDVRNLTQYYQKYNQLREDLHGIDMVSKVSAFEINLEDQMNLETIEYQDKITSINENELRLHRMIYFAIVFIAVLTMIVVSLMCKLIVQKRKAGLLLAVRVSERKEELARAVEGLKMEHFAIRQLSTSLSDLCDFLNRSPCAKSEKVVDNNYALTSMIHVPFRQLDQLSNSLVRRVDETRT